MYNKEQIGFKANNERKSFIHIAVFVYWAILVFWQNIGEYSARSSIDTIIKMGLLVWLMFSYFMSVHNVKIGGGRLICLFLFIATQLVTLFSESSLGLGIIVAYVFPSLLLFLSFVYGYDCKITKSQYITFLNCVIAVVAYSALYALVFKTEQFVSAFKISSAYGNELSSFFVSSHEYGMYLIGGIIACIVCLEVKKDQPLPKKIVYILGLVLFIPNLVLTFSRTSMLAMAIFLLIYVMLRGKSKQKKAILFVGLIAVAAFIVSGDLREFVLKIVLKDNNDAGRGSLYALAIDYFKEGTLWQQLFGRGIEASREYFVDATEHGSVHNGYLQVLVYYGLVGLAFMVCFIICRFSAAIKLIRKDRFIGVLLFGLLAVCIVLMFTNTTMLFNSPIDSFFLTAFTVIMPKYLENGL